MTKPPKIVIVVFPGFQALDGVGPAEVFTGAGLLADRPYEVVFAAAGREPVTSSSGLRIEPGAAFGDLRGPIDTLLLAGGFGTEQAANDLDFVEQVKQLAARSRRVTSVCTGAFLLARAGLLDGRRATTHWASCERLARSFPAIEVARDAIFVRDTQGGAGGDVWTSAGVTAGMDLALALVEEDLGRAAALETARWLVLYVQRPGGQAQFSAQLSAQFAEHAPIRQIQSWIVEHPAAELTVESLAARACMSPRNFARVFRREVGMPPAAYVEAVRVECAQRELEATASPVELVARHCGFGTADTLRRAFRRRIGVGPTDYRARFRPALDRAA